MIALLSPRLWLAAAFAALLAVVGGQQVRIGSAQAGAAGARTELANYRAAVADTARIAQHAADARALADTNQQLKAQNDARTRETTLRTDRDGARSELDRLRVAIRATAARGDSLPGVPTVAVRADSGAIGQLLAQCGAQLVGVAGVADQAVTDVQTLRDSWPVR